MTEKFNRAEVLEKARLSLSSEHVANSDHPETCPIEDLCMFELSKGALAGNMTPDQQLMAMALLVEFSAKAIGMQEVLSFAMELVGEVLTPQQKVAFVKTLLEKGLGQMLNMPSGGGGTVH